ncbi:MAG: hypothetical protein MI784_07690 [Cytophagales bacterium]|nr:hypothetical protein [Cytophagales bacterium]
MKNESICPRTKFCPVFKRKIISEATGKEYRKDYCLVETNFPSCKRYQSFLASGLKTPRYILPDSSLPVEEIVEEAKKFAAHNTQAAS